MRLCISGSRGYKNFGRVEHFVMRLDKDVVLVVGGARGVDTAAEITAKVLGINVEVHPADWERWGKAAGPIRNKEMICGSDATVAFWDGESRGTEHAIKCARDHGKLLMVFRDV